MEKHIVGENGIGCTLEADGLYYPGIWKFQKVHTMRLEDLDGCGGRI